MNVVTLLPAATEIVCALGVDPVGVSHECDYPPHIAEKPVVNFAHVDPEASSAEINEQVAAAERAGGVYGVHRDVLADLDPDVVVTQGICDVCAVDRVLVEDVVSDIDADPEIVTTDPHSLSDLYAAVERIGRTLGREARASEVVAALRDRVEGVRERAAAASGTPRVVVLDWLDPVMVAGHWVPEMVESLGAEYDLADPGDRSEPHEWATIREDDPDVLVAAPCGFGLAQTRENLSDLTDRPGWDDLRAVRDGRAFLLDGHHYMNRPGPRLVDSLEHLAGLVRPDVFDVPPVDVATAIPASSRA